MNHLAKYSAKISYLFIFLLKFLDLFILIEITDWKYFFVETTKVQLYQSHECYHFTCAFTTQNTFYVYRFTPDHF